MSKRIQPPWEPHPNTNSPVLRLYNSLTRQKEPFIPQHGNRVNWYSCGPTVYDASHMGHARSYITFDILRRVLQDYFHYNVYYVMNITDIDDKIIKRARQNYLYEKYIKEQHKLEMILEDSRIVMNLFETKVQSTTDPEKKTMMDNLLLKLTKCVEDLTTAVSLGEEEKIKVAQQKFISECKDPLADWLDSQFGANITDNAIFSELPAFWESAFHKDMDDLDVLRPNFLTRVSEYIPEIIDYIKKIIGNGLAYEANGSVYFDVNSFDKRQNHHYAKLVPEAYGDAASLAEGEGDLTSSEAQNEKRAATDFALWKKSKGGEPAWQSPWGMGRPGWHIECSAMASALCGSTLDIHTGGVDLKFPHHDNEIAQSEAYFDSSEWVKYFLHSGHLTIAGCKMSKSLKNFVSIQDALAKNSARQLRFAFLLHSWKDTLDYSNNTMEIALSYERMFNEFFLNVKDVSRGICKQTNNSTFVKCEQAELDLNAKYATAQDQVHEALCDNIDTRSSLEILRDLVTASNLYLRDRKPPNSVLLYDISKYITNMLRIFGINVALSGIGFQISAAASDDAESTIMPYLTILSEFRQVVRTQARELKATTILKECDLLRDDILPSVGVRLEDKEGEASAVKLVDKDTLLREKELKKQQELEKQAEKERKKQELAAAQAAKDAQKKIPPLEMFKSEIDKYSRFDDKGLPTHDFEGKEISKGQFKKLQKLQQAQEKKYNDYLASINNA